MNPIPRKNIKMCVEFLKDGQDMRIGEHSLICDVEGNCYIYIYAGEPEDLEDAKIRLQDNEIKLWLQDWTKIKMVGFIDKRSYLPVNFEGYLD